VNTGPGLATISLHGTPQLAIWTADFVLPLAEAARRCGLEPSDAPTSARDALSDWAR
jgi:hypothetical protein